jgi:hypothetical protein
VAASMRLAAARANRVFDFIVSLPVRAALWVPACAK